MIKAVVQIGPRNVIVLGLSAENVTRLVAGEPIHFHGSEVNIPGSEIVITYGKTEDKIREDLSAVFKVDLPVGYCSGCRRHAVFANELGAVCGMPQPDGNICHGKFQAS